MYNNDEYWYMYKHASLLGKVKSMGSTVVNKGKSMFGGATQAAKSAPENPYSKLSLFSNKAKVTKVRPTTSTPMDTKKTTINIGGNQPLKTKGGQQVVFNQSPTRQTRIQSNNLPTKTGPIEQQTSQNANTGLSNWGKAGLGAAGIGAFGAGVGLASNSNNNNNNYNYPY